MERAADWRCLLTAGLTLVEAIARRYGARLLARMPNIPFFTIAKTIAGTVGRTTKPATNLSLNSIRCFRLDDNGLNHR